MKINNKVFLLIALLVGLFFSSFVLYNKTKPTLFLIGDSTVKNGKGKGDSGLWGWGSFLADYFDTQKINVENRALGGTSSRTFYNNPQLWQKVLDNIKPGDFVIMQFGHNDSSPLADTLRARGTIKGNGNEFEEIYNPILKQKELVYSYGFYLRRFIKNVQDKGATAIVCSLVPRNAWTGGKVNRSEYAEWAEDAAKQANAYFIPLNKIIADEYDILGEDKVKEAFFGPKDATHTIQAGAIFNAEAVVAGIKRSKKNPLKKYLK